MHNALPCPYGLCKKFTRRSGDGFSPERRHNVGSGDDKDLWASKVDGFGGVARMRGGRGGGLGWWRRGRPGSGGRS